jgi:hypothetical protein
MENAVTSIQMSISAFDLIELTNVEVPRYLKIDVDGLELNVLEGFGRFIANISEILVEIDQRNLKQIDLISKFLIDGGFIRTYQKFGFDFHENQLWVKI